MTWDRAAEATKDARAGAEGALAAFLQRAQDATGLKLAEAGARVGEAGREAKARTVGIVETVKEKAREAEGEAKLKAREAVDRVKEQAAMAEKEAQKTADAVDRKVENKKLV